MESWVSARLAIFLPQLEALSPNDEQVIARLCEELIQALRDRPGLKSVLSLKRPMRELRNAVKEKASNGNQYAVALDYLELTEEEKIAVNQPSAKKAQDRLIHQVFIHRPYEVVARISRLLSSDQWAEVAAGLSCATGRRLAEIVRFAVFHEKSLYSVIFGGQRKTEHDDEFEIPTLVPAKEVIAAWQRLRLLKDFSAVESDRISSSFGEAVKIAVVNAFGDLIESPEGRAQLYTHVLRAAYPRLAIFFFLPAHVEAIAYANRILGHVANKNGELVPNYQSTLYYMTYKILADDGTVDGREGVRLMEPGVEVLEKFKLAKTITFEERKRMMADTTVEAGQQARLRVDHINKAEFDRQQQQMNTTSANETVGKLLEHNSVYLQLAEWVDVPALAAILQEAAEIRLEHETVLDALSAAIADKKRFRSTYDKRSAANAEKDYSSMTMDELKRARVPEASLERWRRAVDWIMDYNRKASMPELRWFINASAVKMLVGGRGTEIGKYLQTRKSELDEHHKQLGLTPGRNHGRTNIRERVLGENAVELDHDENDDEE
jgi:hypothetical protein